MSDSILPQGLIQAYRETHYKTDDGLVLLIDQPNPALAQAQRERGSWSGGGDHLGRRPLDGLQTMDVK